MRHVALSVLFALVLGSLGCGGESASAPATTTSAASAPQTSPPPETTEPEPSPAPTLDEASAPGLGSTDSNERFACTVDADCMITPASSCCPGCCDCPTVMRRDAWEQIQRICSVAECRGNDCRTVRCEPCGIITAVHCVAGRCTAS
ncbi:MAG: hypothetical protein J0L92_27465 [Deltaproteobacteria bacterium]|nr:hypothetical protein [Deltaproteobacteria bacterium]